MQIHTTKKLNVLRSRLTEAVVVEGAEFIGNAEGYDLFELHNFTASASFVDTENETVAQSFFNNDSSSFTRAIVPQGNMHAYIFVRENTHTTIAAALLGNEMYDTTFYNITLKSNMQFENSQHRSSYPNNVITESNNHILPFYLIPNLKYGTYTFNDSNPAGLYIKDNRILGSFKELTSNRNLDSFQIYNEITSIESDAFMNSRSPEINTLRIPDNVSMIGPDAIHSDSVHTIEVYSEALPETWSNSWTDISDDSIIIGANLTLEQRLERETQRAEAERDRLEAEAERARQEAEAAEQAERDRAQAKQREAERQKQLIYSCFKYKVEGDHIIILKGKSAPEPNYVLYIPKEIENKPVTKIAPFAFYNIKNYRAIFLPRTITEIGKGSFYLASDVFINSRVTKITKQGENAFTIGSDGKYINKKESREENVI